MTPDANLPPEDHWTDEAQIQSIDELARLNAASNATLVGLMEKVQKEAETREKRVELLDESMQQTRKLLYMLAAALVLLVALGIANFVNIASTANAARDAKGTYTLLYGCLQPDSDCARRSLANQKNLLDEIKKYQVTGLYCARINPSAADPRGDAFIECMNRLYPGGPQLNDR